MLKGGLKGVEREALRITPEGRISQAPHPHALGSALTHPHITTDYSEALSGLTGGTRLPERMGTAGAIFFATSTSSSTAS